MAGKKQSITIDGQTVRVITKTSNAARSVDIEFKPGEIVIKIPRGQQLDIDALLTKRKPLLTRKYREAVSKIRLLDGDTIHIRGTPHTITTKQTQDPPEPRIEIHGETLTVHIKEMENPSATLKKWITQQTRHLIDETIEKHREHLETQPNKTRIQDTPRWGYANKRGELVYNWQLYTLPPDLAEYVILHEAVHLHHFHHQKGFHRKLETLIPDHHKREKKLQRYIAIPINFQYQK